MTRSKLLGGLVAVVATTAIATSAAGAPARSAQACVPKKNVEAIIDDSGSMQFNDSGSLRVQGLNLLMSTPGNESKTLGAIEFGSDANSIFNPGRIGTNRTQFSALLNQQVKADNGGTDYNAAFALAKTHSPNADSRIFLTDGAHNEDDYANGHAGGPATYVISLSAAIAGTDEARLQQIASDTGGIYRKAEDASKLQAAMNDINATINCQQQPVDYTDVLRQGRSKAHKLKVPRRIRSVQFALSWSQSVDKFDISAFRVVRKGKTVARAAARKVRRLRVKKRRGATFVTVKVSRVIRGQLRFKVRAVRVKSSTFAGATVVTQASRSKRR